jgi:hypothetical protein
VLVVTEQTSLNAIVIEQPFGGAGILAGDPFRFFQDADRPVRDVLQVADGRRDYVEAARNVLPPGFSDCFVRALHLKLSALHNTHDD